MKWRADSNLRVPASPVIPPLPDTIPVIRLRADKEQLLQNRHVWLFSGALQEVDADLHGSVAHLADSSGNIVATGTCSNRGSIAFRVFDWHDTRLDAEWFVTRIRSAHARRELLGIAGPPERSTETGYRVIHGECDSLPGITVDRYADLLVIQLSTSGADHLRGQLLEALSVVFPTSAIFEKSDTPSRVLEGCPPQTAWHVSQGEPGGNDSSVHFLQDGMRHIAYPADGQKTGFFLDQRELRQRIRALAAGRSVLNLFSYTGASGLAAAMGEASSVHHVDLSSFALSKIGDCWKSNALSVPCTWEEADIFQWLGQAREQHFDMVILDPPALIKSQKDRESGLRGYHFLNRAAMRLVAPGGLLVTSSCSHYFTETDLQTTVRRAAGQNGQSAELLDIVGQSPDHPRSLYFPEGDYLCSLICSLP